MTVTPAATRFIDALPGILTLCVVAAAAAQEQQDTQVPPRDTQPTAPTVYTVITGQVFDGLGRGVRDAVVVVVSDLDDTLRGETRTNGIGDFEIKLAGEHPGTYAITVKSPGFKEASTEFEIDADDLEPFIDIGLVGALEIGGQVVDSTNQTPVADAHVALETVYRTFTRRTDDSGRFTIDELIAGSGRLIVDAEGFGRYTQTVNVAALDSGGAGLNGQKLYRAALSREKVLHVHVVDELARPITEVSIELQLKDVADYHSATTDADGLATFKQLPSATRDLTLRLTHRDFVSTGQYDNAYQFPDDAFEARHTVAMQPGATLHGRLLDSQKRGVNGARISVGANIQQIAPHTFTSIDGTYELTGLTPGPSVVTAHAVGYAPVLAELTTTARERSELNFTVRTGRVITGTVIGPDDSPVVGAEIYAWRWRGHNTLGLSALTDDQGRFALEDAPPESFEVDIVAPGAGVLNEQSITSTQNDRYRFKLDRPPDPPPISATLCTAKVGEPCPGFKLTDLDGAVFDSTALKGQWVLLDFWATWCGPCVAELPTIRAIHKTYGKRDDFVVIGISSDFDANALASFLKKQKLPWPQVHGEKSGGEKLSEDLGIRGIPCPILIDPTGNIAAIGLAGEALKTEIGGRLK